MHLGYKPPIIQIREGLDIAYRNNQSEQLALTYVGRASELLAFGAACVIGFYFNHLVGHSIEALLERDFSPELSRYLRYVAVMTVGMTSFLLLTAAIILAMGILATGLGYAGFRGLPMLG